MKVDAFYREIERIVEAPEGSVAARTKLEALSGWDSLAVLSFLALADEQCGRTLSADEVGQCVTVADLEKLLAGALER